MKMPCKIIVALCLTVVLSLAAAAGAAGREGSRAGDMPARARDDIRETHRQGSRAVQMVSRFTETTILAKNPMLVMGMGGAYRYVTTPAERRAELGFFAQPWVFGLFLAVSLLVLAKDTLLTSFGGLKKPLDVLAQLAHWAGAVLGIVFITAGIPEVADGPSQLADAGRPQVFMSVSDDGTDGGLDDRTGDGTGRARIAFAPEGAGGGADPGIVSNTLDFFSYLVSLFVYAVVFVVFNSVEAVLVINPFPFVDPVLKGFRATIIGFIYGLSRIHSGLGFLAALCVFVVCLCVVHFCLRLAIISFVYSIGILRRLFGGAVEPNGDNLRAFSCWHFHGVPWLTYGWVCRAQNDNLEFTYKRLFLAWERTTSLPATAAVAIGTLNPSLLGPDTSGERHPLLRFSPIYLGREASIGKVLQVDQIENISLQAGFKHFAQLLWATLRGRRQAAPVK